MSLFLKFAEMTSFLILVFHPSLKKSRYGNRAGQTFSTLTRFIENAYVQHLYLQISLLYESTIFNDLPNDTNYIV